MIVVIVALLVRNCASREASTRFWQRVYESVYMYVITEFIYCSARPSESLLMLKSLFDTFTVTISHMTSPNLPLLHRNDLHKRRWLCRLAIVATLSAGFLSYGFPGDITGMYFIAIWLWTLSILHDYDDMSASFEQFCSYMEEEHHSAVDTEILKDVLAGNCRTLSKVKMHFA